MEIPVQWNASSCSAIEKVLLHSPRIALMPLHCPFLLCLKISSAFLLSLAVRIASPYLLQLNLLRGACTPASLVTGAVFQWPTCRLLSAE
jgi:hypothetical protein